MIRFLQLWVPYNWIIQKYLLNSFQTRIFGYMSYSYVVTILHRIISVVYLQSFLCENRSNATHVCEYATHVCLNIKTFNTYSKYSTQILWKRIQFWKRLTRKQYIRYVFYPLNTYLIRIQCKLIHIQSIVHIWPFSV